MNGFSAAGRGALVLFVVGATACHPEEGGPEDPRPNVIVFVLDAARTDHLGVHGYGRHTTPSIDAFVRDATVFDGAYSDGVHRGDGSETIPRARGCR